MVVMVMVGVASGLAGLPGPVPATLEELDGGLGHREHREAQEEAEEAAEVGQEAARGVQVMVAEHLDVTVELQ